MSQSRGTVIFLDLEVAGAQITRPILQVAAIAVASNLQKLETFEAKLRFDKRLADPNSLTARRYCEKTWAAEARSATNVARDFATFLRRHATAAGAGNGRASYPVAQLVAHHANFDGPFLQAWFDRVGRYFPGDYRILCTVQRAMWFFQEHPQFATPADYKLGTLCDYFGVPFDPREAHTALADVRATVEVYCRMALLAAAESASGVTGQSPSKRPIARVARVATAPRQACRSRRRSKLKTCRSRRRPFLARRR